MVDRKANKATFVCGVIVLLCGILMVAIQLHGWATLGEKLQFGAAPVLMVLGVVLMAASRHRKIDK
jgi:hypothetical protein